MKFVFAFLASLAIATSVTSLPASATTRLGSYLQDITTAQQTSKPKPKPSPSPSPSPDPHDGHPPGHMNH